MTDAARPQAISCPSCGAGLDVLGGGRVTTHICGFCGTSLDAVEGYRVLAQFANMKRPQTPLRIGDRGRVQGVDHVLIGILGQRETAGTRQWAWVDHLLHSPTHGYGWLTLEDGHLIWTRRWRKAVSPRWIHTAQVESAENRPTCTAEGERFDYYETSVSEITFAEGEFTWRPAVGDQTTTVSLLGPATMLSYAEGRGEREIERSWYLPQDAIWQSFGVDMAKRPGRWGDHTIKPQTGLPDEGFLKVASLIFAGLCLACAFVLSQMGGHVILKSTTIARATLPAEIDLTIDAPGKLTVISFTGQLQDNTWAWLDLSLLDPDDQPLFQLGREIGTFSGRDSEGSWTEDSSGTTLRFRPEVAGKYTLQIEVPETGQGEQAGGAVPPDLRIGAVAGASTAVPPLVLAGVFGLIGGGLHLLAEARRRRRWAGSDWEDDDDEEEDSD
jgi:hypothetical protein